MDWEKFKKQWLEKRENWTDHGGHIAGQETNGVEFRIFKDLTVAFGIWKDATKREYIRNDFKDYREEHQENIDKSGGPTSYVCLKPISKAKSFDKIETVFVDFCNTHKEFFATITEKINEEFPVTEKTNAEHSTSTSGSKAKKKKNFDKAVKNGKNTRENTPVFPKWETSETSEYRPWLDNECNPWLTANIDDWKNRSMFLEADEEKVIAYNKNLTKNKECYTIQGDAYPQPYIGNPEAPIWILMLNPGYGHLEYWETADVREIPENDEIRRIINEDLQQNKTKFERFELVKKDDENLKKRRVYLQKQLSFFKDENYKPVFYPLEEEFNIWKHDRKTLNGCYEWWLQKLLGRNKKNAVVCKGDRKRLNKFFNIEFFPYHSIHFDVTLADEMKKDGGLAHKHHVFWQEMIKYAVNAGKILILRGAKEEKNKFGVTKKFNMLDQVCKAAGDEAIYKNKDNIFLLKSQNACISVGNLVASSNAERIARKLAEKLDIEDYNELLSDE